MKTVVRVIINENQYKQIVDEAEYPESFNMETFKGLSSFKKRMAYADQNLTRMKSGSGRRVYDIDGKTVLKLAMNRKGVAQNEFEADLSGSRMYDNIVTSVEDYDDENYLWIESQKADPASRGFIEQQLGMDFDDYCEAIRSWQEQQDYHQSKKPHFKKPYKELNEYMWDHEFIREVLDMIGSYTIESGDLCPISAYGNLNGELVIIDYGTSQDIWKKHYVKEPKKYYR